MSPAPLHNLPPRALVVAPSESCLQVTMQYLVARGYDVTAITDRSNLSEHHQLTAFDLVALDFTHDESVRLLAKANALSSAARRTFVVALIAVPDGGSPGADATQAQGGGRVRRQAPAGTERVSTAWLGDPSTAPLAPAGVSDPRVTRALDIAGLRFCESRLTSRVVAKDLSMSTEHLCRLFKRQTGTTFTEYLRRLRVLEAMRLLEATGLSVKEIAYKVGLETRRLNRHFGITCGVSPTAYRECRRVG